MERYTLPSIFQWLEMDLTAASLSPNQLEFRVAQLRAQPPGAELIDALLAQAMAALEQDRVKCLALISEALAISEALDYPPGQIRAEILHGALDLLRGEMAAARAHAEAALAKAMVLGERALLGMAHSLEAAICNAEGQRGEAAALGLLALDLMADMQDAQALGMVTELIGICCAALGEPETAADYLERAVEYYQDCGSVRSLARVHSRIAAVLCDGGELDSAEAHLSRAEQLMGTLEAHSGTPPGAKARAELGLNRARLSLRRGRAREALHAIEAALATADLSGVLRRSLSQCKSDILIELGDDRAAEAICLALVAANQSGAIRLHEQLAAIYARRRDYIQALEHFEQFHALDKAEFADRQAQQVAMTRRLHETQAARREAELMAAKNQELEAVVVELRALHQRVWELSRRDGLTGLYNRRYLDEQLPGLFAAQSDAAPLSVLMVDLDDFKSINDRYRHQIGDRVLQEVARIFERTAPGASAFAVRYGGEEFALLLPATPAGQARTLAQELCRQVRDAAWARFAHGLNVTVSVGVADGRGASHPEDLLMRADQAMYAAKRAGKNRVRRFRSGAQRGRV